ncbi:pyruvate formate lyase-activating protein [Isoptericola sp. NEAU-Y5]|uniref:Pyruvate formate-lyase-activating enzyme n=1 Tax=Isoptericola luteus TaxID=2879484 RepID=A0ABS7ZFZ0_9MICO|nr:pyruvate formate-lyase-activating protein [Isoptericola sp. NEAU-Y5]MCA5893933.1 pyruvate formate lyase-activating protein [Isoptericola sp. NEAU-Y5]
MTAGPATLDAPSSRRRAGAGLRGMETADVDRDERLALMRTGELGSVHSWELVTAVDGPGTRLTVFLSGCPLRCLYCHNPDTLAMKDGEPVLAEDLLARVARYRGIFAATGGGITLSGGEVLMQPAFAARVLRGAKELGVHTTLDTSGFLGANATDAMLDDTDLVLLDIKAGDEETYRRVTGRSLAPTLRFGRHLAERGVRVWVRFVLVPGLTDDPRQVGLVADHAAAIEAVRPGTVERVEVLPFHQMARDKWAELGRTYELADTPPPTAAATEAVREVFRSRGLTTY